MCFSKASDSAGHQITGSTLDTKPLFPDLFGALSSEKDETWHAAIASEFIGSQ